MPAGLCRCCRNMAPRRSMAIRPFSAAAIGLKIPGNASRFAFRNGRKELELAGADFDLSTDFREIAPGIYLTGEVPRAHRLRDRRPGPVLRLHRPGGRHNAGRPVPGAGDGQGSGRHHGLLPCRPGQHPGACGLYHGEAGYLRGGRWHAPRLLRAGAAGPDHFRTERVGGTESRRQPLHRFCRVSTPSREMPKEFQVAWCGQFDIVRRKTSKHS